MFEYSLGDAMNSPPVFIYYLLQLDHDEQTPVYFGEWESSWRDPGPLGETFDAGHPDHIDHYGSVDDAYWFTGSG
jgi:hypothetical protein